MTISDIQERIKNIIGTREKNAKAIGGLAEKNAILNSEISGLIHATEGLLSELDKDEYRTDKRVARVHGQIISYCQEFKNALQELSKECQGRKDSPTTQSVKREIEELEKEKISTKIH